MKCSELKHLSIYRSEINRDSFSSGERKRKRLWSENSIRIEYMTHTREGYSPVYFGVPKNLIK
jgi:hypothetical protein